MGGGGWGVDSDGETVIADIALCYMLSGFRLQRVEPSHMGRGGGGGGTVMVRR